MSRTLELVQRLMAEGQVRISDHGYDEMAADGVLIREILNGIGEAVVVEDYPEYFKGPCVLVLQRDSLAAPIRAVWGSPRTQVPRLCG
jgi:hypothetical protein